MGWGGKKGAKGRGGGEGGEERKEGRGDGGEKGSERREGRERHTARQPNVAALEQRSEIGKACKRQRSVGTVGRSYNVGHAVCLRPPVAVTCWEAVRGGRGAAGTHETKGRRTRVQ